MPHSQTDIPCPICKGKGRLMPPSPRMTHPSRREAAHVLRSAKYSLRQIAAFLGYKTVGGVQKLLKK